MKRNGHRDKNDAHFCKLRALFKDQGDNLINCKRTACEVKVWDIVDNMSPFRF
jgi:hypothetical protein